MRIDIPDQKKLTYEMVIPIRWGDMDAMAHVNNTIYFRYFETIRIEWMHSLGNTLKPEGEGFVIVNAFCNFIRQLEYPGDILARHYVAEPGAVELRHLHHARAHRRARRALREWRRDDRVARFPGEEDAAAAAVAAPDRGVTR